MLAFAWRERGSVAVEEAAAGHWVNRNEALELLEKASVVEDRGGEAGKSAA